MNDEMIFWTGFVGGFIFLGCTIFNADQSPEPIIEMIEHCQAKGEPFVSYDANTFKCGKGTYDRVTGSSWLWGSDE